MKHKPIFFIRDEDGGPGKWRRRLDKLNIRGVDWPHTLSSEPNPYNWGIDPVRDALGDYFYDLEEYL